MAAFRDLTGQRFGRLTVLRFSHTHNKNARWMCICDCGKNAVIIGNNLTRGHTISCGCQRDESITRAQHGHARSHRGEKLSATYHSWARMKQRCLNSRSDRFKFYGGRGIRVCERWFLFENFLADMGERPPGLTLDRIENDKSYEPGNCRWATPKEQANNRRHTRSAP